MSLNTENVENVMITSVEIRIDRGCFLSLWLTVEGRSWGVAIGGYVGVKLHEPSDCSLLSEQIRQLMVCFQVESLDDLKNLPCRVRTTGLGSSVTVIGHYIEDRWVDFKATSESVKK